MNLAGDIDARAAEIDRREDLVEPRLERASTAATVMKGVQLDPWLARLGVAAKCRRHLEAELRFREAREEASGDGGEVVRRKHGGTGAHRGAILFAKGDELRDVLPTEWRLAAG